MIPHKVVLFYLGLFNYKCLGEVQIDKVYATTGAAVSLDCSKVAVNGSSWSRLQNLDNNISFTVYTDGITINPLIRNRERIRIIYNQSRGIYQLEILKVSETDEGKYRCSYLIDKDVHDYDVSLKITRPPSDLRFLNNNRGFISGTEGDNVTITCLVDSGVPPETLHLQSTSGLSKGGRHGHINHSLVLNRSMNGTSFTCKAKSDQLVAPLVSHIQLLIKYKPTVHIEEGSQLILTEEDNLVLTCNFSCYPDLHKLEWKHMSYIVDKMNTKYGSTRRLEISKVRNNHSGAFICKVTNEVGAGYAKINITVQYPPLVNIKVTQIANHVKLDCMPQGLPDIFTFEPWEHTTTGGQHIRFLNGYQNGTLVLNETKSKNTLQDTGIYICSVKNGISDSLGRLSQTGHVTVKRNGNPIFGNKNRAEQFGTFGQATTLNFDVFSLDAMDLTIKDEFDRQSDFGSQIRTNVNISVVFHGTAVNVEGFNTKIKTQPLTEKDFGNYTVTAPSRFGNSIYHFILKSATAPLSPYNVTLARTASKIFVRWNRNFDGGYQQEFFIQLLTKDLIQWKKYGPLKDTMQKQQSCTLSSMKPGITYYVRMFSSNKIGSSNLTEVFKVTTLDTFMFPSAYVFTSLSAVCLLIIVAVRVFYKIWKAKGHSNREDEGVVIQPFGNQYHVDNVLYQSQEEINLSGGGGGDGYSTIDRTDPIPQYGAVVSYSAQCSDSDDEEDYENGNAYCTSEVTGKSGNFLKEGEHNAIAIKDDHVLNYSEIVFCPCESPRFVIHGSNNRTVYADVDLSVKAVALPYTDDESSDDNTSDFDDVASWVKTKVEIE